MSFNNKVVIVTGASSGIGAATALLFAKEGADVAIVARTQARLKAVAKKIEATGRKPLIIQADLSKETDVTSIIPKTVEHFGKLDILVNNAGVAVEATLMAPNVMQAYDQVMQTNIRSVVQLTNLAVPHLAKTKGNVVNISSVTSTRTSKMPIFLSYYLSKAAMDHFTRCAAIELVSQGIRVNTVSPGPIDNEFISNNSLSDPDTLRKSLAASTLQGYTATNEEIGDLILFLASDKARSVTGCNYVMDNGWSLAN